MKDDLNSPRIQPECERLDQNITYLRAECARLTRLHDHLRSEIFRTYRRDVPAPIQNAAARTKGVNRTELAKLYGIDRTTLYRRLQPIVDMLPIDRQRFNLEELTLIYLELGIPSGLDAKE